MRARARGSLGHVGCTFVMSTGIVSVDLAHAAHRDASLVMLVAAAMVWTALTLTGEITRHLAGVAATGVLATRALALGSPATSAALALVAAGLAAWHHAAFSRRPPRATGSDLLAAVALQSVGIAVAPWLRPLTMVLLAAGLARYLATILRFSAEELVGGEGDQWIAGGAVAIASVAAAHAGLHTVSVALSAVAIAWLVALVAGEAVRPRRGRADRRWATVFPLGMYAAMSYEVAGASRVAQVVTAIATLAWLIVLVANLLSD
jgi:hypothetical protein